MGGLRLHLYGGVAWSVDGVRHPAPAGRPGQVLAVLAERRRSHTTADHLIDRLWPDQPPNSGRNALQRHISRVRRHLTWDFGIDDDPIIFTNGGYTLAADVVTDLDRMEAIERGAMVPTPIGPDGVRWADEPLPDLPWDAFEGLRGQLRQQARQAALRWADRAPEDAAPVEVARILHAVSRQDPYDPSLAAAAARAARRTGDPLQIATVRQYLESVIADGGSGTNPELAAVLAELDRPIRVAVTSSIAMTEIAAAWVVGEPEMALAHLDAIDDVDRHVREALRRMVRNLDPTDGFVKELFTEMVGMWTDDPAMATRCLISLDARNYEAMNRDEWVRLREEIDEDNVEARVRALRTEAFALMAQPLDEETDRVIDRLIDLGTPDALVEAARFRFVQATRRGRFADGLQLLEAYEATVAEQWPGYEDAFAGLSRLVYSLRPGLSELDLDAARVHRFPRLVSDRSTAELAEVVARLLRDPAETNPAVHALVQSARLTVPLHGQVGLDMLWMLTSGEIEGATQIAHEWASSLSSLVRNRFTALLEVGIARVALQTNSADLAAAVYPSLAPFGGEEIGLWPTDALLGPADDLLQELEALAPLAM